MGHRISAVGGDPDRRGPARPAADPGLLGRRTALFGPLLGPANRPAPGRRGLGQRRREAHAGALGVVPGPSPGVVLRRLVGSDHDVLRSDGRAVMVAATAAWTPAPAAPAGP
jgi:hypothetical protein